MQCPRFGIVGAALLTVASCATGCAAQVPASATKASDPGADGIYVATRPGNDGGAPLPDTIYQSAAASGVYVRLLWNVVQPERDRFDWSTLDREALRAKRAGMKLSIAVRAGDDTPTWLYRDGVQNAQFVSGRRGGRKGFCASRTLPLPWEPRYQLAYATVMAKLATHLKSIGVYENIRIVKITGINERSEETRLPSAGPQPEQLGAGACRISDAVAIWRKSGYRPDKVIQAWEGLAKSVNAVFPDKLLAISIIQENDFPSVDRDGIPVSKGAAQRIDVKRAIFESGTRMFPGRFAVQRTALNPRRSSAPALEVAREMGAKIGMQSNLWRGPQGAGCGTARGARAIPCGEAGYRNLLQSGLKLGATYLEIWPADATRYSAVVASEDAALRHFGR